MQGVTVCPFRVVDEINQGMDPVKRAQGLPAARGGGLQVGLGFKPPRAGLLQVVTVHSSLVPSV